MKWIVWNPLGANPKVLHDSRAEATTEAIRLARMNPGTNFYVCGVCSRLHGKVEVDAEALDQGSLNQRRREFS